MDLHFTPEEHAFRAEVRAFIRDNLPEDIRQRLLARRHLPKDDIVRWQRILNARGWAVPGWPAEWGGTGWSAIQRYIFLEEMHGAPAPEALSFNVNMIGPVLIALGTDAQKKYFLPRAANLDDWWCQGFSEPEAGSDLANLKTRAVRDGDEYVINGQKTWTTGAHLADWMFALVRTDADAKKQAGITFLLIDMRTPGITVRPLETIDGYHEFNEVFFDDVRVPLENRIGEENQGWGYAKFLLGNERAGIARVGLSKERLCRVKTLAAQQFTHGHRLSEDPQFRQKVAAVEVQLKALEITQLRLLSQQHGSGATASILKIRGSELQQLTSELLLHVAGPHTLANHDQTAALDEEAAWAADAAPSYWFWRAFSIFGGSNEIQKNILAKTELGL